MTLRMSRRGWIGGMAVAVALSAGAAWSFMGYASRGDATGLNHMGPAKDFTLRSEHGVPVTLSDYRGKVVLVNFMFTRCYDICPILTGKLAMIHEELKAEHGDQVRFLSVTVDPEYDSPAVLREFAEAMDYDPDGWSFLTGTEAEVKAVANAYGVLMAKTSANFVNHNLLTTVVDRNGEMRVQYLGERFDHMDLYADLVALITGARPTS
ncbi:MAG: SCO family protein [Pikeienuella sp.]